MIKGNGKSLRNAYSLSLTLSVLRISQTAVTDFHKTMGMDSPWLKNNRLNFGDKDIILQGSSTSAVICKLQ